jgi:N-acetylglutamate synthase-like GNAT family acetyltransferase
MMQPNSNIKIVQFSSEYRDQVIKLIDTLLKDLRVIPNIKEMIDDEDLLKISDIYSGRSSFWIAVNNKRVVGTIAVKEVSNEVAKLKRMFVDKKYHGCGLAQRLMDKALSFANNQRFKKIILNTHPLMNRAHTFYKRQGFIKVGEDPERLHFEKEIG